MDNIRQMTDLLMTQWGDKPLAALHAQAKSESSGVAFDAMRVAGGPRLLLVICITGSAQIARLRTAFDFAESGAEQEDWAQLTLLEMAVRAMRGSGFAFEALYDDAGAMSALALIAAEPRSMMIVQRVFDLPA